MDRTKEVSLEDAIIIDCHTHMGYFPACHIPYNNAEGILRTMDRIGISKACVSALASIGPDWMLGNNIVAKAVRKYPHRFIGYAVINPNYPKETKDELKRCFGELNMKAIKIHPAYHKYPVNGPNYIPVFEYAQENNIIILSHTWSNSKILDKFARSYPQVTFIIAHIGGWDGRNINEMLIVAKKYNNIFLDLTSSLAYLGVMEQLVEEVGAEKLLYGSDLPLMDAGYQIGRVIYAKINHEEKKKILGLNMMRLLGNP